VRCRDGRFINGSERARSRVLPSRPFRGNLEVEEIARNLKLELNRQKNLIGIMEKAHSALSRISERVSECKRSGSVPLPSFESLDPGGGGVDQTLQAVAHEIRNPLLAVGGFAKRLASALKPLL
jgi:hypothetical protein